jgi:DNA-binding PadR family transcriptional regulator
MEPCGEHGGAGDGRRRRLLLEAAVLEALAEREAAHGSGTICRLLRRLEQQGFVTSRWTAGAHGPQRREHRLTPDGRAHLVSRGTHLETRERAFRSAIAAIDRSRER